MNWNSWQETFADPVAELALRLYLLTDTAVHHGAVHGCRVAKVKPLHTVPPFFCGKFLSDAVMIFTGLYAAANFKNIVHGSFLQRQLWR